MADEVRNLAQRTAQSTAEINTIIATVQKGAESAVQAIESGKRSIESGIDQVQLAGFPVVDIAIKAVDGSFHDVDSNEMAFKVAGSMAFKEAFSKAQPVLLEPIMKVEIVTPEDYLGDVMGDVSRRRGILQGQDDSPSGKVINAMVPPAAMPISPSASPA